MEETGLTDYSVYTAGWFGFNSYMVFLENMTMANWQMISQTLDVPIGSAFIMFSVGLRSMLIPMGIYQ